MCVCVSAGGVGWAPRCLHGRDLQAGRYCLCTHLLLCAGWTLLLLCWTDPAACQAHLDGSSQLDIEPAVCFLHQLLCCDALAHVNDNPCKRRCVLQRVHSTPAAGPSDMCWVQLLVQTLLSRLCQD